MKRLFLLLLILSMITTVAFAASSIQILNLPEITEEGDVTFDKMSKEELLILQELLEKEIESRESRNTAGFYTFVQSIKQNSDNPTLGERNALESARSYLNFTAFSYTGLIDQLEYEGYSLEEATYAADNCAADWFEQAYKSAQGYLDYMSFSRKGLINQLLYEGYTQEQAEYAVKKVGY